MIVPLFTILDFFKFPVSPLFPSGIAELIFIIVYFVWFYFEIINQVFATMRNKNAVVHVKNDKFSLLIAYIGMMIVIYIVGWLGNMRLISHFAWLPVWAFYIGILVIIYGEFLRLWSEYTLGRFFTYPVMVLTDHELIVKGPYRYVRHPSYLGGMLVFVGLGLVVQSWAAAIVAAIIMVMVYSYRIYFEEQALTKHFGERYKNYSKGRAKIIPYLF